MVRTFSLLFVLALIVALPESASGQEKKDPTAPSDIINETLAKIRDVEKLDTFIQQNNTLKAENQKLKADVAKIKQELAKITKDLTEQAAKLRKQLLQMPTFQVQSKVLGNGRNMALLKTKETVIRIRTDTEMSVPVAEGVWVLMQVKNISKDMIELYFPELERTVYLYD